MSVADVVSSVSVTVIAPRNYSADDKQSIERVGHIEIDVSVAQQVFEKWHELIDEFPHETPCAHGLTLNVWRRHTFVDGDGGDEDQVERLVLDGRESKLFARAVSVYAPTGICKLFEIEGSAHAEVAALVAAL